MNADEWLSQRTFHHSRFADVKCLVEAKRRQGLTISLCLPTLNEAATIGKEIVLLKSALKDQEPLLDEIAVVDSGSTDETREIAASFGADVYLADDHLPECGRHRGKGENLWKALYLLKGEIICYVDGDIKNIHPRFVSGLVGPLIEHPEIHFVKAFYDRPLAFSQGLRPTGGGRVTEILIRPLFSLFYPELAAIVQPLSGEYAGRRSILEQVPFPVGYGVETAMLIDIYERLGLAAFAQTDLDTRVHRNQETIALGRMAFGILRTFFRRLGRDDRIRFEEMLPSVLRQHKVENGAFELVDYLIEEFERPPIVEVEAYRERRETQAVGTSEHQTSESKDECDSD
ncbi:MAG: glucosyl-3-phosphoglycerate synthase [Planctomycetaceae bacterium]